MKEDNPALADRKVDDDSEFLSKKLDEKRAWTSTRAKYIVCSLKPLIRQIFCSTDSAGAAVLDSLKDKVVVLDEDTELEARSPTNVSRARSFKVCFCRLPRARKLRSTVRPGVF